MSGNSGAEAQLAAFLRSYGRTVIDPDGPGPVFESPIADPGDLWCLHYPEPQTGHGAYPGRRAAPRLGLGEPPGPASSRSQGA